MPENEEKKLNPQITDVEIGVRNLRKITVYPLSMSDQLKLTDLITKSVTEQLAKADGGELSLVSFIIKMIQENIGKIITMVTDEDAKVLEEISNSQAVEIADILFDVNYGTVAKNFKSLSEKLTGLFQPGRPSPQSVNVTDTASGTSTESPTETAA